MKKVAFIIASMLVVMVSGCGGGTSSSVSDTQIVNSTDGVVNDIQGLTQFPAVPAVPES